MKRSEIEEKTRAQLLRVRAQIEAQPLPSVGIALAAGILLAAFARFFISILFLGVVALIALWLLADKDGDSGVGGAS